MVQHYVLYRDSRSSIFAAAGEDVDRVKDGSAVAGESGEGQGGEYGDFGAPQGDLERGASGGRERGVDGERTALLGGRRT